MIAQVDQILEEEWRQKVIENADIVEKTPPQFYFKALIIVAVMVAIGFGLKIYAKRKNKK